jgi:benzoyl-CoA reductase/2-hydroxyglutaryl-CoA dehydratase subunit BcrC/BadD/HgdB
MLASFNSMLQHRRRSPASLISEKYYDLSLRYWEQARRAHEEGKPLVAHSACVPPELFYAMDVVPIHIEAMANVLMAVLKEHESFLSLGKAYGLGPEVCSTHRGVAALYSQDWAPRADLVMWSNQVCDNTVKGVEMVLGHTGAPGMFFDVPFRRTKETEQYLSQELEEAASFIADRLGRKLDLGRLAEALENSRQMVQLNAEICRLRQAVPTPAPNRLGYMLHTIDFYWTGTPEGVEFYRAARDELKERADRGQGYAPQENLRLLSIFQPMAYSWKMLDWMEREHGACFISEPFMNTWGDIEWDFSQPLITLARRLYAHPTTFSMHGPASDGLVDMVVKEAQDSRVDGAIYWAHTGCRQACAAMRMLKDVLNRRAEIPMLSVDIDLNDPTFAPEDDMKNKLEGFFEMLEERKDS